MTSFVVKVRNERTQDIKLLEVQLAADPHGTPVTAEQRRQQMLDAMEQACRACRRSDPDGWSSCRAIQVWEQLPLPTLEAV